MIYLYDINTVNKNAETQVDKEVFFLLEMEYNGNSIVKRNKVGEDLYEDRRYAL